MKATKRAFALLLALVLTLALSVTAFAADTTGSITIDNAVKDQTYTIYRIFDLNSHNADYTAFNYKVSEKWTAFFAEGAEGRNYVDFDELGYVTWKKGASAADFAAKAIKFASDNSIANDGQAKASSETVKFENLPLGYYLVQSDLGALCSLDTAMPDVTIKEKNGKPSVDKQVQEDSNSEWGKTNDADLNQVVNFKTTITVSDGNPANYVLHDQMSAGLTFDASSVTVKIGENTLAKDTDYTLVTEGLTDGCTFEIRFIDDTDANGVKSSHALKPNDVVIVSYSALVNENAVIAGIGNPNETWLDYGDGNYTEHSTTRTYVWKMEAFKYTKNGETETPLKDAQFVLYKEVDGVKHYAIVDASNKITGWTTEGVEPEEGADASKTYASVFTTLESGKFSITGLDADTYYLEEIKAPAGYNMLKAPIKIVIKAVIDPETNVGTATVTYNETSTGEVKVENKTGTELPSTGGTGTTIFYVLGGLLVVGAGVLLVTRKRMGKSEN